MADLKLSLLEEALDYNYRDPRLLEQALTHRSRAQETEASDTSDNSSDRRLRGGEGDRDRDRERDNEALELLGDSVLGLIACDTLYQQFPSFREGQLSKLRAHLVSQSHLVRVARRLNLGAFLRLGRGEDRSGGREKPALLVDALEAVLGAMYLDGGLEACRALVLREVMQPEIAAMNIGAEDDLPVTDFKSALQEVAQGSARARVVYEVVEQSGPDHHKAFTVDVSLQRPSGDSSVSFRATASTKKRAEQDAARLAMESLFPKIASEASAGGESQPTMGQRVTDSAPGSPDNPDEMA